MTTTRILVAIDESPFAAKALDAGAHLARLTGAQVALVFVVDPRGAAAPEGGPPPDVVLESLRAEGKALLVSAEGKAGFPSKPWHFLRDGRPAEEILATAREWDATFIVIGTHGRSGLTRLLMGSTAEAVLRHAPCPVLIVPGVAHVAPTA
jgi:nucleotide-binding universal stress UspA family protein